MKNIKTFESFVNEKNSWYVDELIYMFSNSDSMEMMPDEFAAYVRDELGYNIDDEKAAELHDAYWSVGAMKRFHNTEKDWLKFLKKFNIK